VAKAPPPALVPAPSHHAVPAPVEARADPELEVPTQAVPWKVNWGAGAGPGGVADGNANTPLGLDPTAAPLPAAAGGNANGGEVGWVLVVVGCFNWNAWNTLPTCMGPGGGAPPTQVGATGPLDPTGNPGVAV
jgi:hypothetical protein